MDTTKQNKFIFSVPLLKNAFGILKGYFKYLARTPIVVSFS